MIRFFMDSSVLFSAAYSSRGHSRALILMAVRSEIILAISQLVLIETRRNLAQSAPELIDFLDLIEANVPFEIIQTTTNEIRDAARLVALKDAPIVAAARKGHVKALVTLDKKHLLGKPEIADYIGTSVLTPKEAVDLIQNEI